MDYFLRYLDIKQNKNMKVEKFLHNRIFGVR